MRIICDFDGTIALEDVTDSLLERFADPSWEQVEAQWLAGSIGSRECMARQVSLIAASVAELNRYLDGVRIDPSFPAFVDACERRGDVALCVASDGIEHAVKRILANHGLERLEVFANVLRQLPGDRYRLEFPHSAPDCAVEAGNCKCAIAGKRASGSLHANPTILVGDGTSDFCVASSVDFVFAKDRLLAHCQANAIPHLPFETFLDVRRNLAQVISDIVIPADIPSHLSETPSEA